MEGTIDKIWENETKGKKQYHVLEIGGEKYSVWDSKMMEGLGEGSRVAYDWKKSGDFRKITDLRKIDSDPATYRPDRKAMEIIRMSCLRSASEILHGFYIEPEEKARKALDIARDFEKYVTDRQKSGDAGEGAPAPE
jgi:hypothetical protein